MLFLNVGHQAGGREGNHTLYIYTYSMYTCTYMGGGLNDG